MEPINIEILSREEQLEDFMPLFKNYMHFYRTEIKDVKYMQYFKDILDKESVHIIVARDEFEFMGMVVLYESLSSFACGKIMFINDLWVEDKHRGKNVGVQLMRETLRISEIRNCKRVDLQTEKNNKIAQSLYRKMGFKEDKEFTTFNYNLA